MTSYPKSAYGADPGLPWNEQRDNGWGAYYWPQGVPASLLADARSKDGTVFTVRREIRDLLQTMIDISEQKFGYAVGSRAGGGYSGSYDNRSVAGSSSPSAHSRGLATDIRAQDNPQSWTWSCTIPPELVHAWESCGFYWGGRYVGAAPDPMHFAYIRTPSGVAADLARARSILGGSGGGKPTPPPVQKPPIPAPSPSKPRWPLSSGNYLGLITGPMASHGGDKRYDGADVIAAIKYVQTRMNALGFGPIAVDGEFGPATKAAVARWQAAKYKSQTTRPGEVWSDDWSRL